MLGHGLTPAAWNNHSHTEWNMRRDNAYSTSLHKCITHINAYVLLPHRFCCVEKKFALYQQTNHKLRDNAIMFDLPVDRNLRDKILLQSGPLPLSGMGCGHT